MRKFLFKAVVASVKAHAVAFSYAYGALMKALDDSCGFLLEAIDKDRLEAFQFMNGPDSGSGELQAQDLELKLCNLMIEVRDHAIENGAWTENHEVSVDALVEKLVLESGWEELEAHQYAKRILEVIPGLDYDIEEP